MPCIGVMDVVNESKQFEWKISDFLDISVTKGSYYSSPSFVFCNTPFYLNICPNGDRNAESGYISLYLINESNCPMHITYEWYIKKADGKLEAAYVHTTTLRLIGEGCLNFYNRSNLFENKSELLPSGILTIVCILKYNEKEVPDTTENEEKTSETMNYQNLTDLDTLSENLKDLSANKDSCDVTLKVQDKEFKAHKAILMARSPVFVAMFKHDTLEKKTGSINVQDCDCESFQEFLDFLYSGKLEDVSFRSAFHLYSTSHKYEVLKLQEFCTKYLIKSLATDNVCEIVELADKYDETVLIAETQNFFNENMFQIFPTAEWQRLTTNNLRLSNKLLIECSKAKGSQ